MFKRKSLPQRKPFNFSRNQIIEDIKMLCDDEEQRNKLYLCLEEKPPQDQKFSKLEEFLRGTNNLEDVSKTLEELVNDVHQLKQEISENINELKKRASSVNVNSE